MRVFRMILGEFRKEGGLSERAVREKLGVCSFDVLVRRHRLLYAPRVAKKAPPLLHACEICTVMKFVNDCFLKATLSQRVYVG